MDGLSHHQLHDQQGTTENSLTPVGPAASRTVIVVRSEESASVSAEEGDSKAEINELETSKESAEERKVSVSKSEGHASIIDIKCSGGTLSSENWDDEKICRICLLSSDQSSDGSDTILLGCACKDELGFAHRHCAETWFRLKGNRCCEICGETAKNITGVADNRFMEEWNESGFAASSNNPSSRGGGFWRGQPFCNFLMACLVIAFVLPWFLRVNIF
ncbi:probable E3 ubiquitin ligase SUD1 [Telopea speciosissima]|uniref:probable E3 ubiquitin ligase SUD1 n=1 Tax=Telopea speciosissima TaxID=54955 RepID=UPI001CC5AA96|nr:probable E3 ubiquitin ligase SUD1 [Telopea speciosissima]